MAKQKGIIRVKGSIGGLTFYDQNGQPLVRETTSLDKEKILNDPNFKRTRENMAEFGGSAHVGKALRTGLAGSLVTMAGPNNVGLITKLMKEVNATGAGLRGQRSFEILNNAPKVEGFNFNKNNPFDGVFVAPATLTANADRSEVTWNIPDFATDAYVRPPEGATHFRLVNTIAVLSDYEYSNAEKGYKAVNPAVNEHNATSSSGYITIGGMVGVATIMVAALPPGLALTATSGLIACTGIEFYQELNGAFYLLASGNAMKIGRVF